MIEGSPAGCLLPQTGSGSSETGLTEPVVQTVARVASVAVANVDRYSNKRRDKCARTPNTNPLASARAKHVHADDQSNTVTDLVNKQQIQNALAVQHGVESAVEATIRVEKSSQRHNDTVFTFGDTTSLVCFCCASRNLNEKIQYQDVSSCDVTTKRASMLPTRPQ